MKIPLIKWLLLSLFLVQSKAQACFILFYHDDNQTLVGNHEDWFAKDAAVRIIPPTSNTYGSVIFTFESEGWAQGGMNDQGLFFDGAYTPFQEVTFDSHVEPFPGYIWQAMLDRCKSVEEALHFLQRYELPGLAESHILLADANGNAVVLGVQNGKLALKERQEAYLLQTNFNPWHPELSEEPACDRYQSASTYLNQTDDFDRKDLLNILQTTHQEELTIYSNIYDLKNKTITTFNKLDFQNPIEIDLENIFDRGACLISLDSMASNKSYLGKCRDESVIELLGSTRNEEGVPIAFSSIGIPNSDIGTIADPDGTYRLTLPKSSINDTIHFSSIGYSRLKVPARDLLASGEVTLTFEVVVLDEVIIEDKKRKKVARLGRMGGKDGSLPLDTAQGGAAIAVLLEAPEVPFYVDKLQLRLMYNSKDTSRFRLHFYEYDSTCHCPGEELLNEEIILEGTKKYGWLRYDLREKDLYMRNSKFFVGYEWIDDRKTREQMILGLKDWNEWKKQEHQDGNPKVDLVEATTPKGERYSYYKYNGNMMNWPGWNQLPPFTGLMVETGKNEETINMKTFERRTSFGEWVEKRNTLCTVVVISY